MPDPQILRLTGVEVQIELWRGSANTFDAFLTYANGDPVDLTSKRVIFRITDKVGGALKYQQIVEPGSHISAAGGQTRLSVPPSVTSGLTDARSYTWKHVIFMEDAVTHDRNPFFYGDVRVLVPASPLSVQALGVSVGDSVGTDDGMA